MSRETVHHKKEKKVSEKRNFYADKGIVLTGAPLFRHLHLFFAEMNEKIKLK